MRTAEEIATEIFYKHELSFKFSKQKDAIIEAINEAQKECLKEAANNASILGYKEAEQSILSLINELK